MFVIMLPIIRSLSDVLITAKLAKISQTVVMKTYKSATDSYASAKIAAR